MKSLATKTSRLQQWLSSLLLLFLAVCIVWKGGKALDAVWGLSIVAVLVTIGRCADDWSCRNRNSGKGRVHWFHELSAIAFMLWTITSFAFSKTQNYGLDEVMMTTSLVLIFLWVIRHATVDHRFSILFARTLSVALLLACLIGIVVYVYQPVTRFVGTFFDHRFTTDYWPNAWAEFVVLAWPFLLWTLSARKESKIPAEHASVCTWRNKYTALYWMPSCVLGIVLGCFLLSFSRGAWMAFSAQVVLLGLAWITLSNWKVSLRYIAGAVVCTAVIGCIVFAGINHFRSQYHPLESAIRKVTFQSAEGTSSIDERSQFFVQATRMLREQPLFGYGPYSFRFIAPRTQEGIFATSDHPHNVFLKLAAERGVIAALLFACIMLFAIVHGIRYMQKHSNTQRVQGYTFHVFYTLPTAITLSVAGVILHNLIDYNLQFVGIALPLWICFALLLTYENASEQAETNNTTRSCLRASHIVDWLAILIAVGLAVVICVEGVFLFVSREARKAEALSNVDRAITLYAWTEHSFFPRDAWLSRSVLALNASRLDVSAAAARAYISTNPFDARGWRLLGDIALQTAHREDALQAYERAFEYAKANDAGILRGLVYLLQADTRTLRSRRHEIDSLLNEYAFAMLQNTHFIALTSNVEQVIETASMLARAFPADAEIYRVLIEKVRENAEMERARSRSRPRGYLW